jgi:SAM-dependent methyltransferase
MLDLTRQRGLKYPDEFLLRFFFIHNSHKRTGRVLELGCGNGNNLALYHTYGWEVVGVDVNAQSLQSAAINFEGRGKFLHHDLSQGLPPLNGPFDVVLMPASLYYVPQGALVRCLKELCPLLCSGALFYIRMRLRDDYRYGRGRQIAPHSFILDTPETGEAGCLNVFYSEEELKTLLESHLGVMGQNLTVLRCRFDNVRAGRVVPDNSDVIIWGKLSRALI